MTNRLWIPAPIAVATFSAVAGGAIGNEIGHGRAGPTAIGAVVSGLIAGNPVR
jgi:uncharacterized protein YcfJ